MDEVRLKPRYKYRQWISADWCLRQWVPDSWHTFKLAGCHGTSWSLVRPSSSSRKSWKIT